jgi:hypothetical protein
MLQRTSALVSLLVFISHTANFFAAGKVVIPKKEPVLSLQSPFTAYSAYEKLRKDVGQRVKRALSTLIEQNPEIKKYMAGKPIYVIPQEPHLTHLHVGMVPTDSFECINNALLMGLNSVFTSDIVSKTYLVHFNRKLMLLNNFIVLKLDLNPQLNVAKELAGLIETHCKVPVSHFVTYQKPGSLWIPHITLSKISDRELLNQKRSDGKTVKQQVEEVLDAINKEMYPIGLGTIDMKKISLQKKEGRDTETLTTFTYKAPAAIWEYVSSVVPAKTPVIPEQKAPAPSPAMPKKEASEKITSEKPALQQKIKEFYQLFDKKAFEEARAFARQLDKDAYEESKSLSPAVLTLEGRNVATKMLAILNKQKRAAATPPAWTDKDKEVADMIMSPKFGSVDLHRAGLFIDIYGLDMRSRNEKGETIPQIFEKETKKYTTGTAAIHAGTLRGFIEKARNESPR